MTHTVRVLPCNFEDIGYVPLAVTKLVAAHLNYAKNSGKILDTDSLAKCGL